ncbi:hypothetical protein [Sutcliffiella horikoshii]|uniref:Uncharacterized protein n=1 Tax=Sutcliffiella horikoshii TaxID=79883 RepID=A0A5D4T6Z4_9BACI|nr:hypothetical protein [Sutcliffiella horikoshii]TYS69996.1 hypothetical protein FZC75_15250 [Sutcliffiella horikoshii]
MKINQEILCPVCRQPFANNELVVVDGVNTVYHVLCEGNIVEPSSGLDTFKEICKRYGFLITNYQVH